jgi:hypothetical protein
MDTVAQVHLTSSWRSRAKQCGYTSNSRRHRLRKTHDDVRVFLARHLGMRKQDGPFQLFTQRLIIVESLQIEKCIQNAYALLRVEKWMWSVNDVESNSCVGETHLFNDGAPQYCVKVVLRHLAHNVVNACVQTNIAAAHLLHQTAEQMPSHALDDPTSLGIFAADRVCFITSGRF